MEPEGDYSAAVQSHFAAPRNTPCHVPARDVVFAEAGNEADGVHYRLSARLDGRRLAEVRFEAYGCPHSIAAASMLTEFLTGKDVESVRQWNWRALASALDLPTEKRGRLLVLEDAVHALMQSVELLMPKC